MAYAQDLSRHSGEFPNSRGWVDGWIVEYGSKRSRSGVDGPRLYEDILACHTVPVYPERGYWYSPYGPIMSIGFLLIWQREGVGFQNWKAGTFVSPIPLSFFRYLSTKSN